MAKRILVTGGAGFIGSHTVRALELRGHDVVVCDRLRSGGKWKNLSRRKVSEIEEPEELGEWLSLYGGTLDGIIHLAAVSSQAERDADLIVRTNLSLSQELWRYAEARGLPFVYASSARTYGDGSQGFSDNPETLDRLRPLTAQAWSKHLFDLWTYREDRKGGAPPRWAGLKFFNVYGTHEGHKKDPSPVESWARARKITIYKARGRLAQELGKTMARDWIYVVDAVNVILWALETKGLNRVLNVGTGQARTWQELGDIFSGAWEQLYGTEIEKDLVPMPRGLEGRYQWVTEADTRNLREYGYELPWTSLEDSIGEVLGAMARGESYL